MPLYPREPRPTVRTEERIPVASVEFHRAFNRLIFNIGDPLEPTPIEWELFSQYEDNDDLEDRFYAPFSPRSSLTAVVSHIDALLRAHSARWFICEQFDRLYDGVATATRLVANEILAEQLWGAGLRVDKRLKFTNVFDTYGMWCGKENDRLVQEWLEWVDIEDWYVELVPTEPLADLDRENIEFRRVLPNGKKPMWKADASLSAERPVRDGGWQKKTKKKGKKKGGRF